MGTSIGLRIELLSTASIASFPIICLDVPKGLSLNKSFDMPNCLVPIGNLRIKLDIRTDLEKSLIARHDLRNICALRPCVFALDKRLVVFQENFIIDTMIFS